jgi:hypothetical protein
MRSCFSPPHQFAHCWVGAGVFSIPQNSGPQPVGRVSVPLSGTRKHERQDFLNAISPRDPVALRTGAQLQFHTAPH